MRQKNRQPKKDLGPIIDRLALKLIARLGLSSESDISSGTVEAMSNRARAMVHGIKPSSLGILISQCTGSGTTSIYGVYGSTWLPRHSLSGRDVLRATAALAVVARALDTIPSLTAPLPQPVSRPPITRRTPRPEDART